jgi:acetyltransferase-like isoleucine patch superfamily enzyme
MGLWRARAFALRYRRRVQLATDVWFEQMPSLSGCGRLVIADGVRFGERCSIQVEDSATVFLGPGCYLNGTRIIAADDVVIGARCILGPCTLMTSDWHGVSLPRNGAGSNVQHGPIRLGDDVWLAEACAVLRGVTIGDRSVVGYGSVVTRDVASEALVVSQQLRTVRRLNTGVNIDVTIGSRG